MSLHSRELAELYLEVDQLLHRLKRVLLPRDYRDLEHVVEWWKALTPIDLPERSLPSEPEEPPAEHRPSEL